MTILGSIFVHLLITADEQRVRNESEHIAFNNCFVTDMAVPSLLQSHLNTTLIEYVSTAPTQDSRFGP